MPRGPPWRLATGWGLHNRTNRKGAKNVPPHLSLVTLPGLRYAATNPEIEAHDGQLAQLEIEETAIDAESFGTWQPTPLRFWPAGLPFAKQEHVVLEERLRVVAGLESCSEARGE